MKIAPVLLVALALGMAACAAPNHDPRSMAFGGSPYGIGNPHGNDLRDSPALSSTATLPRLHGPDFGSADRAYDSLGAPAVLPPASPSVRTNPLVGVVPGGEPWP